MASQSGDIDAIQSSASMKVMTMQVEYAKNVRDKYPKFILHYFYKPSVVVKPNINSFSNR